MTSNEEIIKKVYLDPKTGFVSAPKIYKKIKEMYPSKKISRREIENFIKNQGVNEIHAVKKINKDDFNPITAQKIGFPQMDIIDLSNYARHNGGYKFILILVDIKSRMGFVEPLKTKTANEVYEAFLKISYAFEHNRTPIYAIYSDKGNEFNKIKNNQKNLNFRMFFKQTKTYRGTGIVDNRIKNIRNIMERNFTQNDNLNWFYDIEKINQNINNTINKNIKNKPYDIFIGEAKNNQDLKPLKDKPVNLFEVGDFVRIKSENTTFSKNSTGRYSNKIYRIKEIHGFGMLLDGFNKKSVSGRCKKS